MLVTTWRSGSTFLGDLIASQPGTFYHYEPLAHLSIVQVRSGHLAVEAVDTLRSLMRCNYSSLGALIVCMLTAGLAVFQDNTWSSVHRTPG